MEKRKEKLIQFLTVPVAIAIIILLVILILVIIAPIVTPYDPDKIDLMAALQAPGNGHLFGTDHLGRDQFTRLLFGGRTSLINAFLVVLLAMMIGIPMGLLSGYYGGIVDSIWMRVCDFILAFPVLLLAFVLVVALGRGGYIAVIAMAIVYTPGLSKVARSLIITEKTKGYVETCRSESFSNSRIIFKHILPNCIPTLSAEITLDFGYAIVSLTSLSFLGLGVQPPQADWGCMLSESITYIFSNTYLIMGPAIIIVLITISLNILSDGISRYLDPEQRKVPTFKQYQRKLLLSLRKGKNEMTERSLADGTDAS